MSGAAWIPRRAPIVALVIVSLLAWSHSKRIHQKYHQYQPLPYRPYAGERANTYDLDDYYTTDMFHVDEGDEYEDNGNEVMVGERTNLYRAPAKVVGDGGDQDQYAYEKTFGPFAGGGDGEGGGLFSGGLLPFSGTSTGTGTGTGAGEDQGLFNAAMPVIVAGFLTLAFSSLFTPSFNVNATTAKDSYPFLFQLPYLDFEAQNQEQTQQNQVRRKLFRKLKRRKISREIDDDKQED